MGKQRRDVLAALPTYNRYPGPFQALSRLAARRTARVGTIILAISRAVAVQFPPDKTSEGPTRARRLRQPWKEALDRWFELFLAFFFPHIHHDIDWSRGYETLDAELRQVVRDAELGRRYADKLVRVWLVDGTEEWLLIHVEVQGRREEGFARRVFVYNYRIFDRYNKTVVSLVVLADDSAAWRPNTFRYGRWGCEVRLRFEPVKLLDYAGQEAALEADANPFATIVLAHLKALETRQDDAGRHQWKLRLVRGLYDRGFSADDVRELFRLIDWMMELPPALEQLFDDEIARFEEERKMPYVTSIERRGRERGRQEGRQEGLREGLLRAIEPLLRLRFGPAGSDLVSEVRQLQDSAVLQRVCDVLTAEGSTLQDVRGVWSSGDGR